MELSLAIGATLTELNTRMGSREFALWNAYLQIQPRGPHRDNYHAAIIASLIANVHAPKGKKYKLTDFMLEDPSAKQARDFKSFVSKLRALSTTTKTD